MRKAEAAFIQAAGIKAASNNALDVALNNLGDLYQQRGQYAKAEDAYKQSLQVTEARLGDSHSNLSATLGSLGLVYTATGRYKEAESVFERSIAILEKRLLSDGKLMLQALHGLAKTYIGEHDEPRAEPLLARAVDIARRHIVRRADTVAVIEVMETYSKVLEDLQNPVEAERLAADARRLRASMLFTVQAPQAK
jgi:tetratricopeptide (TPR) repeat protein